MRPVITIMHFQIYIFKGFMLNGYYIFKYFLLKLMKTMYSRNVLLIANG